MVAHIYNALFVYNLLLLLHKDSKNAHSLFSFALSPLDLCLVLINRVSSEVAEVVVDRPKMMDGKWLVEREATDHMLGYGVMDNVFDSNALDGGICR